MDYIRALRKIQNQLIGRNMLHVEAMIEELIADMEKPTIERAAEMQDAQTQVKQKLTDLNKLHNPQVTFGNDH